MSERTNAARLKTAFMSASTRAWPDLAWSAGDREDALRYPQTSPTLGAIEVWFDDDEITLSFGPRGYHQHHGIYDPMPSAELALKEQQVASTVVDVIKALLVDELVVRWGLIATSVHRQTGAPSRWTRWWRRATPWVREAVWSGTPRR